MSIYFSNSFIILKNLKVFSGYITILRDCANGGGPLELI